MTLRQFINAISDRPFPAVIDITNRTTGERADINHLTADSHLWSASMVEFIQLDLAYAVVIVE